VSAESSRSAVGRDGVALAVGTLTAVPVPGPRTVDRPRAAVAMSIAPLAVLPAGLLIAAAAAAFDRVGLPPLVSAALVIGAGVLLTRALHVDGLADTVDGLASSYDRDRALTVMRTGDVGPAGTVAVVLVVGVQVFAAANLLAYDSGWLVVAVAWCCARTALAVLCVRGVAAARPEGLGATVAGSVPAVVLAPGLVVAAAAMSGAGLLLSRPWWQGALALVAAVAVLGVLLQRCRSRLGGITGDVLGAGVEVCAAVLLVVLSAS